MSKYLKTTIIILVSILAGCTFNSKLANHEVSKSNDEVKYEDFIFRLVSEKEKYHVGEEVRLYGEVEYVGEKDEVKVPLSATIFSLKEMVRDYEIRDRRTEEIAEDGVLTATTLKQGEPYRIDYEKSGTTKGSDTESYRKFIRRFVQRDGFPPGYYVMTGYTEFLIGEKPEKVKLEAKIDFKIVE
ncbi:hypothetical protein [Salinibacillus xinjiangensis]|uniref:DUF3221 domain-containing protein n=1 Tax=Salinibacillus xinjiangensis TaxID=1229268 RepID=A0A6G1X4N5_9BACI|nr:hypothetical protein [Salinibacillus xinjiangensis]MRG85924.1 hypothetical protein [Salinibacillus xinjiangensis]